MAMANTTSIVSREEQRPESLEPSSTSEISEYHTAHSFVDLLQISGASDNSTTNPTPDLLSSVYYSARIESMIESRSKLGNGVESEIESSKVHWTEQDWSDSDEEYSVEDDREYFETLKKDSESGRYRNFFKEFDNLVVGEKIAEGAQGEVYEASCGARCKCVVKVFKRGIPLRSLRTQMPEGMFSWNWFGPFSYQDGDETLTPLQWIHGGTLLKDEKFKDRFAIVMWRQWGDLRKVIDERLVRKSCRGPPFHHDQVLTLMFFIAQDMYKLHETLHIIHKDLKASNVLVRPLGNNSPIVDCGELFPATVADYECSVGVMGTGFWRAPEILLQLKNGVSSSNLNFTTKADVYSYGMTCYEIVTGCIPYEGHLFSDYDVVLSGQRPTLPSDLNPLVREVITTCWHNNPSQRPDFYDICFKMIEPAYSSMVELREEARSRKRILAKVMEDLKLGPRLRKHFGAKLMEEMMKEAQLRNYTNTMIEILEEFK